MIPLTFLYDEYIDRPKLTGQKKPFEYIVPSPTSGVGTKNIATSQTTKVKTNNELNNIFFTFLTRL